MSRSTSTRRNRRRVFRGDIQGLRAVAVIVVLLNHMFGWPAGGFVGVDVFFVLSGFLITGLLLREVEATGTIALRTFYIRRIKRLLPAGMLVILATVAGAYALVNASRFASIAMDAAWASLFAANWRFALVGTDYFQESGPVSPLQHYWSLAVEEQFYFVWPFLLIAIAWLVARKRSDDRFRVTAIVVGGVLSTLVLASFAWSLLETVTDPTFAYFSTLSRAWELGAGALLAVVARRFANIPRWLGQLLSWAGLAGIAASVALVDAQVGFPAPFALLPVAATALVIVGGIPQNASGALALNNPVMRYIGDISYSLYLWHFPVIILLGPFLEYLMPGAGIATFAMQLVVILVLSVASYHLVENPIRHSSWLTGTPRRRRRRTGRFSPGWLVGAVAGAAVIAVLASVVVDQSARRPETAQAATGQAGEQAEEEGEASGAEGEPEPESEGGAAQAELASQISAALAAESWPETLTPSLSDLEDDPALVGIAGSCGTAMWKPAEECTIGDPNAPKLAVIAGDSIAQAYIPGLAGILGTGEWRLRIVSMYACPFVDLRVGDLVPRIDLCEERRAQQVQEIIATTPDLVVVGTTYFRSQNQDTGRKVTTREFVEGFRAQLDQIAGHAQDIVLLPPPAPDADIVECYTPYSVPSDCVSRVAATEWGILSDGFKAAVEEVGGHFVDNRGWFCDAGGMCPAFVGSTTVKKDQAHITAAYSIKIEPVIRETLQQLGIVS